MENNISRPFKGLHTDSSYNDQPKDTYTFALNSVRENDEGNSNFISNEESNKISASIKEGYIIIGKQYLTNSDVAIFSVSSDESLSEIGIYNLQSDSYEEHVNTDLGFSISNQIDSIYSLKQGCKRTIYFVDGINKPRIYNFDNPEDFKDNQDNWDINKFNLFKTFNSIPEYENIEVLENGQLASGSYNFAIQYLDESLNPTEWLNPTDTIIIYNDSPTSKSFSKVRGSTNAKTFYQDFSLTNKSIRLDLNALDSSFPFYRIAIIESTNGSGEINRVTYTQEIPTSINTFTYTGDNFATLGTVEEIQQFSNIIEKPLSIEQIENTLVLANTKGPQINWCNLQSYASKISADLITEKVFLNNLDAINNPKRATVHNEKVGYMPGELYSFGIVYVLEGNIHSPVFHIPGANNSTNTQMSKDNELEDTFYTSLNNCNGTDSWGVDSVGDTLLNKKVRHHRFPNRAEVGKSVITKESGTESVKLYTLNVNIIGTPNPSYTDNEITYLISGQINGNPFQNQRTFSLDTFTGEESFIEVTTTGDEFTNLTLLEKDPITGNFVPIISGLSYSMSIDDQVFTNEDASVYSTDIFGIKFKQIDKPSLEVTGGREVLGYYIVRNERTESQKTILDSGVLTPLMVETGQKTGNIRFVAHGHLNPNNTRIQSDTFGLIHPEHRFSNQEYRNITSIVKEGEFVVIDKNLAESVIEDVQPGTSYDPDRHKKRDRDDDGFSLNTLVRSNTLEYNQAYEIFAKQEDIDETFYLDSLFSKNITDIDDNNRDIYNLSADNKIGILKLNKSKSLQKRFPYVILKRDLANPYSNYRVLPYFKESTNMSIFTEDDNNQISVFNGDVYISPMRYTSSMFYDIRLAKRKNKRGLFNVILGALSVIAGAVLTVVGIATGGSTVAAGVAVMGFGLSQLKTGITKEQMNRVYREEYEQGLKDTVQDLDTQPYFGPNPNDDTIQWFHDILDGLWFESTANINWRMGATNGVTDFLNPSGYNKEEALQYCIDKVTSPDSENDDGKTYQGYAKPELYEINRDYRRRNKEKIFFHLALEYDCCSDCIEEFPYRVHYSKQSFQEELSDNYRIFLPNNYRDIEGTNGEITDLFRIQNNLYIQTEEALWHLPQNIQERITNDVVSFIGTGSFFSIPPRKILDDSTGNSAGSKHKWATLKTPHGVYFVSENQGVIYEFNGNKLSPISSKGMYSWFKKNIQVQFDKEYLILNDSIYSNSNNPSHPLGTGFISTYDSKKERVIFTKKDFALREDIIISGDSYRICNDNGDLILFDDYDNIISTRETDGWTFVGLENCQMNFERPGTETREVQTEVEVIKNNLDIHIFYDITGNYGDQNSDCNTEIADSVSGWIDYLQDTYPDWEGNVYSYYENTEEWLKYPRKVINETYGGDASDKDVLLITFNNESNPTYTPDDTQESITTNSTFLTDYNQFVTQDYPEFNSFQGLLFPLGLVPDFSATCEGDTDEGMVPKINAYMQHCIAVLYGRNLTLEEIDSIHDYAAHYRSADYHRLRNSLQSNPYNSSILTHGGLMDYGWSGIFDVIRLPRRPIFNKFRLIAPLGNVIESGTEIITETKEVEIVESLSIDGINLGNSNTFIDKSWTLSYNLKTQSWDSFHSYLPNIYINSPEEFSSWKLGNNNIWRHGIPTEYQTYYGELKPFIIEYVSVSNPLYTRIWDSIKFLTTAKKYNSIYNNYNDDKYTTFNKVLFYNSNQTSGILNLVVKNTNNDSLNYLQQQVQNLSGDTIIIDKNEKDWSINDLRNYRTDFTLPMFDKTISNIQDNYFTDKIVNTDVIDYDKDWFDIEPLRDKYLVIRLIFDNLQDVKLIFNYSIENENISHR